MVRRLIQIVKDFVDETSRQAQQHATGLRPLDDSSGANVNHSEPIQSEPVKARRQV